MDPPPTHPLPPPILPVLSTTCKLRWVLTKPRDPSSPWEIEWGHLLPHLPYPACAIERQEFPRTHLPRTQKRGKIQDKPQRTTSCAGPPPSSLFLHREEMRASGLPQGVEWGWGIWWH